MSIKKRINNYLQAGGLFNPELMEHDKVRDLLMACLALCDAYEALEKERDDWYQAGIQIAALCCCAGEKGPGIVNAVEKLIAERDRLKAEVEWLREKLDSYEDQDNPNSEEN